MELKIRYVWRRKSDGKIWMEVVPLDCVEGRGDAPFIHKYSIFRSTFQKEWDLVGRDLWTGKFDKEKQEIYENDILEFNNGMPKWEIQGGKYLVIWDEDHAKFSLEFIDIEEKRASWGSPFFVPHWHEQMLVVDTLYEKN